MLCNVVDPMSCSGWAVVSAVGLLPYTDSKSKSHAVAPGFYYIALLEANTKSMSGW